MSRFAAAAAAALLLPAVAAAQPASTVTEAEFLAPFDADHPALVALGGELGRARAEAIAARTFANPALGAQREDPDGAAEQLELTLAWPLPDPARRRLAIAAADARVEAAGRSLRAAARELRLRLREAYAEWAVAEARVDRLASRVEALDALTLRERRRAEAGEAAGLDARRLALAAAETRAALAQAEAQAALATARARAWRPDLPERAMPTLPELAAADRPAGVHSRVAALEAELRAARLERDLAGRVFEMPEVVAGWQRQEEAGGRHDGPILGLTWPLPIFDRNRAERAAAQVRVDELEARLALLRRDLAGELEGRRTAYRRLRDAAAEAAAAAAEGAPAVEAAAAAFRLGEADLTTFIDTLRSASAAELAALDLHAAALAAERELARASPPAAAPPQPNPESHHDLPLTTHQEGNLR